MELVPIVNQYYDAFMIKYVDTILPGHLKALNAIGNCRTPDSGEVYLHCPDCNTESKTGKICFRTLKGEDFLSLLMQHVLPKGFRRVRDYGFLHSNAKKLLLLVQLILQVVTQQLEKRARPVFKCPCCQSPMVIPGFRRIAWKSD